MRRNERVTSHDRRMAHPRIVWKSNNASDVAPSLTRRTMRRNYSAIVDQQVELSSKGEARGREWGKLLVRRYQQKCWVSETRRAELHNAALFAAPAALSRPFQPPAPETTRSPGLLTPHRSASTGHPAAVPRRPARQRPGAAVVPAFAARWR